MPVHRRELRRRHRGDLDFGKSRRQGSTEAAQSLPGYGDQKARIFLALLGKQIGVEPKGWRQAAGDYGLEGSRRSIADVVDEQSLLEVREFKKAAKAAAKADKK